MKATLFENARFYTGRSENEYYKYMLVEKGLPVRTGRFRTHMEVELINDGPVTILFDSKKIF